MTLIDLLYNRWNIAYNKIRRSYSAESLSIGDNDVWVYVAEKPQFNYAVTQMLDNKLYYLKLHWGMAQPHVFTLRNVKDVKKGIEYLISANKIMETYAKDIDEFLLWYIQRLMI